MSSPLRIIIHGGYINESNIDSKPGRQASVQRILADAWDYATTTTPTPSASQIAVYTVSLLEDDPLFNAGTGSRIQSDGKIRMTASLIDSQSRKFSGVINIQNVKNPSQIALMLQKYEDSVLAAECAKEWATAHGFADHNPEVAMRREEFDRLMEQKNNEKQPHKTGTVGCVVLQDGVIASCTSTGGKGCEIPGRVSDSGNVAGCFASRTCGVSITGVGEDAMATSMASAICIRRDDGMTLDRALERTIEDLNSINGVSGAVCLDIDGNFAFEATVSGMVWAYHDGSKITHFE